MPMSNLVLSYISFFFWSISYKPFAGATNSIEAHLTEMQIFQDDSAYMSYENGTGLEFLCNFLGPVYLY